MSVTTICFFFFSLLRRGVLRRLFRGVSIVLGYSSVYEANLLSYDTLPLCVPRSFSTLMYFVEASIPTLVFSVTARTSLRVMV